MTINFPGFSYPFSPAQAPDHWESFELPACQGYDQRSPEISERNFQVGAGGIAPESTTQTIGTQLNRLEAGIDQLICSSNLHRWGQW